MKYLQTKLRSLFIVLILLFVQPSVVFSQALVPGDIAFSGYNSRGTDRFSFVLLTNLPAGTVIKFTDNGWLGTNVFRTGEGDITWTVPAGGLIAGREVTIDCAANTATLLGAGNPGTVTGTAINFNTSGDQVIAYQGTLAAPTSVIAGLQMNVTSTVLGDCYTTDDAAWDGACSNASTASMKPSGGGNLTLTTGVNALWIGSINPVNPFTTEWDNARFNCSSVPASELNTVSTLRSALNNKVNWQTDNLDPSAYIPPAGCLWLGLFPLPVTLEGFSGKLNSDKTVLLQWRMADQTDVTEYTVERHNGDNIYTTVGTVAPGYTDSYSMLDSRPEKGMNYYRLRISEVSGKKTYSKTVPVNNKPESAITLYPNPVKDKLQIQKYGTIQPIGTIMVTNASGKMLEIIRVTGTSHIINLEGYATGVYFLKTEDGAVHKFIKE